jgi:hypothetical protein
MIVILGVIILVAAVIVTMAGVLGNGDGAHALTHGFAVFGYHVTGSTGALFLYGVVVGAAGLLGLSILLAGARRTSRRGRAARRSLGQSRRETAVASQARDDLITQRETARASTAGDMGSGTSGGDRQPASAGSRWSRLRLPGRGPVPQDAAVTHPEPLSDRAAPDASADPADRADGSLEEVSHP